LFRRCSHPRRCRRRNRLDPVRDADGGRRRVSGDVSHQPSSPRLAGKQPRRRYVTTRAFREGEFECRKGQGMPADALKMPDPIEHDSLIPTLNQQGAIWLYVDAISQAYLDFAGRSQGTLLEIAAGYGHMVIRALEAGAGKVFANEIDARQLAILKGRVPARDADRVVCYLGEFPDHVAFPEASFDGVYTARLFHFFDGERIRVSLSKLHRWVKPAGKVFLVSDAIYRTIFKAWIPAYERRVAAGDAW